MSLQVRLATTRKRARFETRRVANRLVRGIIRRVPARSASSDLPHIALVAGHGASRRSLGSALNRLAVALGAPDARPQIPVDVLVPRSLAQSDLVVPESEARYLDRLRWTRKPLGSSLAPYTHIVLADAAALMQREVRRHLSRVSILDPAWFRGTEFATLERLAHLVDEPDDTCGSFTAFLTERRAARAVVVGTGPSLALLHARNWQPVGPVIGCNSLALEPQLLEWLRPAALCFADEVTFVSSQLAHGLREGAAEAARRYGTRIVVPRKRVGTMRRHHPDIADQIVGIELAGDTWHIPSPDSPWTRPTVNVMTMLVIPIAAALAPHLDVVGCDGRAPHDTGRAWANAGTCLAPIKASAPASHPALYRDLVYAARFREHDVTTDALFSAIEAEGGTVSTLTHSWLEAFAKRQVAEPVIDASTLSTSAAP